MIRKILRALAGLVVCIPAVGYAEDIPLTPEGLVPGAPFQTLQEQVDELRARLDALPPSSAVPRPAILDTLDQEVGVFIGFFASSPWVYFQFEGQEFAVPVTAGGLDQASNAGILSTVNFDQPDCQGNAFMRESTVNLIGTDLFQQSGRVLRQGVVTAGDVYVADVTFPPAEVTLASGFATGFACTPAGPFTAPAFPAILLDTNLDVRFTPPFRLTVAGL